MNSSENIEVIKSFPLCRGRPATAKKNEKGQNLKQLQAIKKWTLEHRDVVNRNKRNNEQKKRDRLDQCNVIISVIKELINQKKLSVPQELLQLIQAV